MPILLRDYHNSNEDDLRRASITVITMAVIYRQWVYSSRPGEPQIPVRLKAFADLRGHG